MSRTPLVLIPGLLCDALLFQHQIAALSAIADCWVPDCREFDSIEGMASNTLARCPFERFAVAALSMGGYVAFELIRRAPARISRLALLDTSARPDTPEQTDRRLRLIEIASSGRFATIAELLAPALINHARFDDPELRGLIRTMAQNTGADAFIRQEHAIMRRSDSRPTLSAIHCPTLILCGRQDTITPYALHQEMASAIPGADMKIIEDCGHLSTLEQPEEVSANLRHWLLA